MNSVCGGRRVVSGAVDTYAMEHTSYPADVNRGIVPPGMAPYFNSSFDFTKPTPIGGLWDWDKDNFGFKAGVSVVNPSALRPQLVDIDGVWDDGNLISGHFQDKGSGRYSHILEERLPTRHCFITTRTNVQDR